MGHFLKSGFGFVVCLLLAMTMASCDDEPGKWAEGKNEYDVMYYIQYSTINPFHNMAHVSYTTPYGVTDYELSGCDDVIVIHKVPKGFETKLSTFVKSAEAMPNTRATISIEVRRGDEDDYHEVASAEGDCPLADQQLEISYVLP